MIKKRVKFTFPQELITEPIIYEMARKFEVMPSIRRADVREDMGWVVLEIEGEEDRIDEGIEWVKGAGVRGDAVSGDVVEG